ncbi:MipA/OmpV family protein [Acidovorax sp. SUPP2522]|nr:MipA/OmpV family protein [Acidovorax sp. GBBC 1281]GKT19966.1 MipA/OmpV family protein [Acidovorax sp. SUPP2522]
MNTSCSVLACLLTLPMLATAQTASQSESPSSPRWGLGLGLMVKDSPYAGEGTKTTALPLIRYEGERFYFRGLTAGAHLMHSKGFSLDAIASLRTDGISAKDFGVQELARNGINRSLLEDRDNGLDLGVAASWRGAAGEFELSAKADVTGASEGFELSARYGYGFQLGRGRLTPSISVSHLSKDMANYYYGTLNEEVARGVVDYKPGAATIPKLGLTYVHPIGQHWQFMTALQYKVLPKKITNSPLLKAGTNGEGSVMFGLSRSF